MEKFPTPATAEEEKDYFSMTYEEVLLLSPEEQVKAAEESGMSVERFLEIKKRASENAIEDFVPSKTLVERVEAPETDLKRILRSLPEIDLRKTITQEDIEKIEDVKESAYVLMNQLRPKMHSSTYRDLTQKITDLFSEALRAEFVKEYNELVNDGDELDAAYAKVVTNFKEQGAAHDSNLPKYLLQAYSRVAREADLRLGLDRARSAFLDGNETPAQHAQWERLRRAAYRGMNGRKVTAQMLNEVGIYDEYERTIPPLILAKALEIGVSSGGYASGSTGSAEKFSAASPDAYSRQNRPRRINDDLESF